MAKDTITLALNGDQIPINVFAVAMENLADLIRELSKEYGLEDKIQWIIQDLQISSAIATVRGESDIIEQVERVVEAYDGVGAALESGERPDHPEPVVKAAKGIISILDKQITSVRFETANRDRVVSRPNLNLPQATINKAFGVVEGRVQTLTNRKGLRFTLFDTLRDRAVSCYLREGQEETMREAWGKMAIIEGEISRDALSGRPIAVRNITSVRAIPESIRGNYLKARGIAPLKSGMILPEIAVRRIRDAS